MIIRNADNSINARGTLKAINDSGRSAHDVSRQLLDTLTLADYVTLYQSALYLERIDLDQPEPLRYWLGLRLFFAIDQCEPCMVSIQAGHDLPEKCVGYQV